MSFANDETPDTVRSFFSKYPGLSTRDALNGLYHEIFKFRNTVCHENRKRGFPQKIIRSSFHHSSYYSTFSWIPICIAIVIVVALFIYSSSSYGATIILLLTILNVSVVYWNNYLRFTELKNRIDYVLKTIKKVKKKNKWRVEQFPNLYTPNSPSVTLHWTIRDGHLINLPSILLTKGDIIVMRPGQSSPADAETIYPPPSPGNKYNVLVTDQLFACEPSASVKMAHIEGNRSVERPPVEDRLYEVIRAPYIAQLNAITNKYLERPLSLYDKARYLLFGKCLHHVMLPTCFVLCEILAAIRWYVFPQLHCKNCAQYDTWSYFFVIETSSILISLVSLVFPTFWFVSNAVGNALLLSRYSPMEKRKKRPFGRKFGSKVKKSESSYFDDIETSFKSYSEEVETGKVRERNNFWRLFLNFVQNNGVIVVRCTNFLHTMASVTVLCCVDKKGVLSFPNPIAEKIFFLKNSVNQNPAKNGEIKNDGRLTVTSDNGESNIDGSTREITEESRNDKFSKNSVASVEVLDITPRDEKGSAWKIEFDDSRWRYHLPSLKPLGLAILLNTCNRKTHKTYNHFCAHITSHALQNKHLVPVANRRCLCELARQIGFHERSVEFKFDLQLQLFTYKNLAEKQAGNKYVKAIFKTRKPKFPFPHAMSVIVGSGKNGSSASRKERKDEDRKRKRSMSNREDRQMFSQGTADVILDYCVDYWDGYDVHPLTPAIRKKILDFYQRSSLTAYCSAFSYRPIYKMFGEANRSSSNSAVYVELLKNLDSHSRFKRRKRRRSRHDCRDEQPVRVQRFTHCEGLSVSVSSYTYCCKSYFRAGKEPTLLQDVTECDEDIDDNLVENIDEYDEDIDCLLDEYDNGMEYDDFSDESEDEYENAEPDKECQRSDRIVDDDAKKTVHDSESSANYFQILGKQIFLGMVSMQYQPLVDMVQMIEELEKACIRFVHFSKENELRSRVFSEKMGLESGWNCHISLLPDADSTQLVDNYSNDGVSTVTDHEMSSTVETGASSADDEENVPFTFDMSNRAKLPCGIRNIRPHLEQVDNVPLLVSLFTDCTSDTTEQMLAIMQEYGQVVCVLGSSANIKNFPLFAQANASISVEPLYAQVCQQIPSSFMDDVNEKRCFSPTELSHLLNSLPCSLILQRNYDYHRILPIYPLIAESRNIMRSLWNCSQFWLSCIAITFTVQLLALLLLLPAIFDLEQALWISFVITPCLSISLATTSYDPNIMTKAKGKDWLCSINWTTIKYAATCYGTKLLCGIVTILISYIIELMVICNCLSEYHVSHTNQTVVGRNSTISSAKKSHCIYVFFLADSNDEEMETEYVDTLNIIQYHMALILSLNLAALCVSFLHRDTVCWKRVPRFNSIWLLFVLVPLSLQVVHFVLMINFRSTECLLNNISLLSVRSSLLTFLSPCLTYLIGEIVKIHEIKINERYQKKVRLEFGTKLGMNSPF